MPGPNCDLPHKLNFQQNKPTISTQAYFDHMRRFGCM